MAAGRQSAGGDAVQSGMYAFLFTDVEGSTSKWEEHPEAMRRALARHDAILRESIAAHGGHVFSTAGDAFCAAFPTVPQALAAALACQTSLQREPWPEPLNLAVRMAVHAGSAEARGGDYFGPTLNRTARILSAGHGGQALLSEVAHDLSRESMPPGVSLKALGEFRLKDLGHPEQVYQLCHGSIASEFPRLRTLESLPGNLPPQVTSFVGRERELEQAVALLEKSRLVTLIGTGGCGKTRLALQIAAESLERFAGGVWMVELAPLSEPAGVVRAAADAMGVEERAGQSLESSVLERLATEPTLLLLDNCEHLLAACTALASSVLRSAPGSRVLATSREPLGVTGEATYRVPSLGLPDSDDAPPEEVEAAEATRLFLDRVRLHRPDFTVSEANARALASVCRRLDGIPLAIELAAARVRSLSIEELDQRLDQCFRILTGGSRSALPRQQTLRSLIDWSFNLLAENEKMLMTRLSVFSGGWSLEAAEAVCSGSGVEDWEVLDLLTSLVDKSLVTADTSGDAARYGMLETVRQYAAELLASSEGAEALRSRHLAYFSDWAHAGQDAYFGPEESAWLDQLDLEHGNISKALSLGLGAEGEAEPEPDLATEAAAVRLASACGTYWYQRSRFAEGLDWLHRARSRETGGDQAMSARNAFASGSILVELGRAEEAAEDLQAALTAFRTLGLKEYCARTLNFLGTACKNMSRYDEAREHFSESHRLFVDAGDSTKALTPLVNLANMESERQNFAASQPVYAQLIEEGVRIGNAPLIAQVYSNLRYAALLQGDYDAVLAFNRQSEPPERQSKSPRKSAFRTFYAGAAAVGRLLEEGPELAEEQAIATARADLTSASASFRKLGMLVQVADALGWLARLERFAERPADAWRAAVASLRAALQTKARHDLADSCDVLALVLADEGQPELAAKCLGASEIDREEMGVPRFPLMARQVEGVVGRLLSEMGDQAYEASHQAGRDAGVSAVAAEMAALLA